jgi:nucleoside-triphosphatase THEP1
VISAIIYTDGREADAMLRQIADDLASRGVEVAGFVQRGESRSDRARCDMVLEEMASGERVVISEDRGALARGCMLNINALVRAETLASQALDAGPDLFIVNKFGKTEAEGRGFRPLISAAVAREVPVLLAVPVRNLEAWNVFADGLSTNHPIDMLDGDIQAVIRKLGLDAHTPAETRERSGQPSISQN